MHRTAESQVLGPNSSLGSMGRLRTKVCTAAPPYSAFDCSNELDGARLDGPVAFFYKDRLFFVAREHILGVANKKRTALYEIHNDFSYTLHGEFPSAGDTSYAGVAPMFGPTDIWQATIYLSKL